MTPDEANAAAGLQAGETPPQRTARLLAAIEDGTLAATGLTRLDLSGCGLTSLPAAILATLSNASAPSITRTSPVYDSPHNFAARSREVNFSGRKRSAAASAASDAHDASHALHSSTGHASREVSSAGADWPSRSHAFPHSPPIWSRGDAPRGRVVSSLDSLEAPAGEEFAVAVPRFPLLVGVDEYLF